MLAYPYILALSRAFLDHSDAIQGRVFMAPFLATELNAPNLEQVIADTITGSARKQYPLSLILPPASEGSVPVQGGKWEEYRIHQIFVKQEGRDSAGDIQQIDFLTNNSQHTITQDWHDMRRVALSYLRLLTQVGPDQPALSKIFRVSDRTPFTCLPITRMANDRLNGVLLTFRIALFEDCTLEDYPSDVWNRITPPLVDQHPQHPL